MNTLLLKDPPPHIVLFERAWFGSILIAAIVAIFDLNPDLRAALSTVRYADEIRIGGYILISAITVWFVMLISRRRQRWAKWMLVVFVGVAAALQPAALLPLYEKAPGYVWLAIAAVCLQLWSVGLLFTAQSRSWFADRTAMGGLGTANKAIADDDYYDEMAGLEVSGGALARSADFLTAVVQLAFWVGLTIVAGWYAYEYWNRSQTDLVVRLVERRLIYGLDAMVHDIEITNVGRPTTILEVRVNQSPRPDCVERTNKRLYGGQSHVIRDPSQCGTILRVDVTTENGATRYDFTR